MFNPTPKGRDDVTLVTGRVRLEGMPVKAAPRQPVSKVWRGATLLLDEVGCLPGPAAVLVAANHGSAVPAQPWNRRKPHLYALLRGLVPGPETPRGAGPVDVYTQILIRALGSAGRV